MDGSGYELSYSTKVESKQRDEQDAMDVSYGVFSMPTQRHTVLRVRNNLIPALIHSATTETQTQWIPVLLHQFQSPLMNRFSRGDA